MARANPDPHPARIGLTAQIPLPNKGFPSGFLGQGEANRLLIRAWETAALGALEDVLLSLDEENALARYVDHFSLAQQDLDRNGVQTSLVQAAVIRDVTQGIIPKRQRVNGAVPST